MIKLKGYDISNFPFPNLELVGVLLYHDFPSTVVYANDERNPVVFEWVDCSDDRNLHRYLVYKCTVNNLARYIEGQLSHLDLMKSAIDGFVISFDEQLEERSSFKIVPFCEIPSSYLPKKDIYFDLDEEVELDDVREFFNITHQIHKVKEKHLSTKLEPVPIIRQNIEAEIIESPELSQKDVLKNLAKEESSEVINMHIKEGDKIGFGTADTYVLGRLLTSIDDLYREVALDQAEGVDRDNLRSLNSKRGQSLYPKISTQVVLTKAASYSVFIKPIEMFEHSDISQDSSVLRKVFSLFNKSSNTSELSKVQDMFSPFVYRSYQDFLEVIKVANVDLECNFYDPVKEESIDQEFQYAKTLRLLENIKYLSTSEIEEIKLLVQFKALNCNTGHYTLRDNEASYLKGHFSQSIITSMAFLNFTDYYQVTIERKKIVSSEKTKAKIEDTIVSCIKDNSL